MTRKRTRANGEGSIFQRGKGKSARFVAVHFIGWEPTGELDANGVPKVKEHRKYFYGKSKQEARERRDQWLAELAQGAVSEAASGTFGAAFRSWLDVTVEARNAPSTVKSYRERGRIDILPYLARLPLALEPKQLSAWHVTLRKKGKSVRAIEYAHSIVKKFFSDMVTDGTLRENPAKIVKARKSTPLPVEPLSPEQVRTFLTALAETRYYPMYLVLILLGLRKGELLRLSIDSLNIEQGTLIVRDSKSDNGLRTLNVPGYLSKALEAHLKRLATERETLPGWKENGLLFPSLAGTLISGRNLTRHFKGALKQAGLPTKTRVHDLRHTCAALLIATGADPLVVQQTLGHASPAFSMSRYGHLYDGAKKEAVERVADVVEGVKPKRKPTHGRKRRQ